MAKKKEAEAAVDKTRVRATAILAAAEDFNKANTIPGMVRKVVEGSLVMHLISHGHTVEEAKGAFETLYTTGSWKCGASRWECPAGSSTGTRPSSGDTDPPVSRPATTDT